MDGLHLLGEWFDCDADPSVLSDAQALREVCLTLVGASGLTVVGDLFHQFAPHGVTGTILLAESHLAIHTWPETRFASIDVFVCNFKSDNHAKARQLFDSLRQALRPGRVREQAIRREGATQVLRAA
jgi:S-adenosylmethionine decarboxylase proenzyme